MFNILFGIALIIGVTLGVTLWYPVVVDVVGTVNTSANITAYDGARESVNYAPVLMAFLAYGCAGWLIWSGFKGKAI